MQELAEFAKYTGFPISTIKRILGNTKMFPRHIQTTHRPKTEPPSVDVVVSVGKVRKKNYGLKGHRQRRDALRAWIGLYSTRSEILEAYYETENESSEEYLAVRAMEEIFLRDIGKISTIKEAEDVLLEAPRGSSIECAALIKMYEIYTKTRAMPR